MNRKTFIAIITTFILICTTWGLYFLLTVASYLLPFTFTGISGSLIQNNIHIKQLAYTKKDTVIYFKNITIKDIQPFQSSLGFIGIDSVSLPYQVFLHQGSSDSRLNLQNIHIKQAIIETHQLLKPLLIDNIRVTKNKTTELSFYYDNIAFNGLLEAKKDNMYHLKLLADDYSLDLLGTIDDDKIAFTTSEQSDLHNLKLTYLPNTHQLDVDIDHQTKNSNLTLSSTIDSENIYLQLEKLYFKSYFNTIHLSGLLDTQKNNYSLDGQLNQSSIKIKGLKNNQFFIKSHIDELADLSPYAEGDCDINIEYSPTNMTLFAHSKNLYTPFAKIQDLQLSIDPSRARYLNLSAGQLRNPLILLKMPSLSLQQREDGHHIKLLGFYEDTLQQINASIHQKDSLSELTIDKFLLQHQNGILWHLDQSKPITIDQKEIKIHPISLSHQDQHLSLKGHYNLINNKWHLHNTAQNTQVAFNSQGIIDTDTEINIDKAILNMDMNIYSTASNSPTIKGFCDISYIQASILNIVPAFPFPLDYDMQDAHIRWENGHTTAELYSQQGNVAVTHDKRSHSIQAANITFNHHTNTLNSAIDLNYANNTLSGLITLNSAAFVLDPGDSFDNFPKDIDIIGEVSPPKPQSSGMNLNLSIQSRKAPLYLYGFEGLGDSDLTIKAFESKPVSISGKMILHEPRLTLLNKLINLKSLNINYQQQSLLNGELHLALEETVNISSSDTGNNISTSDIQLIAFGPLKSPSFTIKSTPIALNQFEAFTHIFAKGKDLPLGNENYALLEMISGLKRNQGIIVLLQSISYVSKFVNISLRPGFNQKQSSSDDVINTDLTLFKEINDKLWLIIRHRLNEDHYNYGLNYKITPWLSTELQYNQDDIALNLLYKN